MQYTKAQTIFPVPENLKRLQCGQWFKIPELERPSRFWKVSEGGTVWAAHAPGANKTFNRWLKLRAAGRL